MENAQQRINAFTNDLRQKGARPGAAAVTNFITGLNGQMGNVLGVIDNILVPITGRLFNVVIGAILGPTF